MLEPDGVQGRDPSPSGEHLCCLWRDIEAPWEWPGPKECSKEDSVSQVYLVVVIQLLSRV